MISRKCRSSQGKKFIFKSSISRDPSLSVNSRTDAFLSNFLVVLFNFLFTLFICPFRLVVNPRLSDYKPTEYFVVKSYFPHKIICGVFSALSTFAHISVLISVLPGDSKNPPDHLQFLSSLAYGLITVLAIQKWWVDYELFAKIANLLISRKSQLPQPRSSWFITKTFLVFFCLSYTIVALLDMAIVFEGLMTGRTPTFHLWWDEMIVGGERVFFVSNGTELVSEMRVFLGVLGVISRFHMYEYHA